jgi:hypothetical protein
MPPAPIARLHTEADGKINAAPHILALAIRRMQGSMVKPAGDPFRIKSAHFHVSF